jgi:hypothetical protein
MLNYGAFLLFGVSINRRLPLMLWKALEQLQTLHVGMNKLDGRQQAGDQQS